MDRCFYSDALDLLIRDAFCFYSYILQHYIILLRMLMTMPFTDFDLKIKICKRQRHAFVGHR